MAHLRDSTLFYLYGLTMAMIGIAAAADPTKQLSSGNEMPVIGLGTWLIKPEEAETAITAALDNGYRMFDTSLVYNNVIDVGKSLKAWFDKGNKREDLFVSSMLPPFGNRAEEVEKYTLLALQKMGLEYFDLYSVLWPTGFYKDTEKNFLLKHENGSFVQDYETNHMALWKAMEDQVKAGRAKSIGLSNFNETQLMDVYNNAEIKPSNLQIEWHIYHQQKQLLETCRKNNIAVTSFSTLGSPGQTMVKMTKSSQALPKQLMNPTVQRIADSKSKTPAQILLRHAVQNDVIVIPKSAQPDRIKENHEIFDFELSEDESKELNELDMGEDGRMFDFLSFEGLLATHSLYPFSAQLKNVGTY